MFDFKANLTRVEVENLLEEVERVFEQERKLIELKSGIAIFVGDTHGDFEATQRVIDRHLKPGNKIIFLGDYVDRGPQSEENINYLLSLKRAYPEDLFLLMGNHETYGINRFYPADFWEGLDRELYQRYALTLLKLPLAVSTRNRVVALHGALPEVRDVEDINNIKIGSKEWRQITWGDWQERGGRFLGDDPFTGRPQFGRDYFQEIMDRWGKRVLIRSHQPNTPPALYDRRCLTIFTSSAYQAWVTHRTIAIVDPEKEVKTTEDITIETV